MQDVELRRARKEDAELLFGIRRAALRVYVERTWGEWDDEWQRQMFTMHFQPARVQVIRCEGVDVGLLEVESQADRIYLANIEILPAYQRRGIGTHLIRQLQEKARRRGVPLTLQVLKVNPAKALYEQLGFVQTGETGTHYQMRWKPTRRSSG